MSAAGYRTREPIELENEEPMMVRKLIDTYHTQLHYTPQSLADLLSLTEQECCAIYPGTAALQARQFPSPFKDGTRRNV
jgi:hypothetical protein